jgi:hypothetical protein
MHVMRTTRLAIAAGATLLLAACLPVSTKAPVGSTVGFANDPALNGTWLGRSKDDPTISYFHFLPKEDKTITMIGVTPLQKDQKASWATYTMQTATLGRNHYMNVHEWLDDGKLVDPAERSVNVAVYYTIEGDTLKAYILDEDKIKAMIAAHKIKGTVDSGKDGDVHITEDPAKLDAMLAGPDAPKLFKLLTMMNRVK